MAQCQYCGRELRPGEICGCTIGSSEMKDYYQIAFKKESLDRLAKLPRTVKDAAGRFFTSIREIGATLDDDVVVNATDGHFESGMAIVDECVVPTDQEITIRQYDIARMSTPLLKKAYGRLQVTNKRIIFRSAGRSLIGPIITEKEFAIEEIGGVDIKVDYRFSLLVLICSMLLCSLLSGILNMPAYWLLRTAEKPFVPLMIWSITAYVGTFLMLFALTHKRALKSAALFSCCLSSILLASAASGSDLFEGFSYVCGVVSGALSFVMLILSGIVDDLQICIKVKGGQDALEIARKLAKDERSGFAIVKPWKDTQYAVRELGALINDIKLLGNAGIEKWKI